MTTVTLIELTDYLGKTGGIASAAQLKTQGASPGLIAYAIDKGIIEKLTRGVYCTSDVLEDDFIIISSRWKKCIFSHESALYLNGLSDRLPANQSVTVPVGYNPQSLKIDFPELKIYRVKSSIYPLGEAQITTPSGNLVRCYDAERSIADLIKQRKTHGVDSQLIRDAIVGYFNSPMKNLTKLAKMCDALGVREQLQVYLEVL